MKRLLALVPVAVLVLAGCAGDTCTSSAAHPTATNPTCSLTPGSTATISVALCAKCTDTSPSCQAEFVGGGLEVAPVVQQCQEQANCNVTGCNVSVPTASCSVSVPASASGSMPLTIVGDTTVTGTVTFGGGSSCSL